MIVFLTIYLDALNILLKRLNEPLTGLSMTRGDVEAGVFLRLHQPLPLCAPSTVRGVSFHGLG